MKEWWMGFRTIKRELLIKGNESTTWDLLKCYARRSTVYQGALGQHSVRSAGLVTNIGLTILSYIGQCSWYINIYSTVHVCINSTWMYIPEHSINNLKPVVNYSKPVMEQFLTRRQWTDKADSQGPTACRTLMKRGKLEYKMCGPYSLNGPPGLVLTWLRYVVLCNACIDYFLLLLFRVYTYYSVKQTKCIWLSFRLLVLN